MRIFSRDDMKAKLQKEFGVQRNNEVTPFIEVFKKLKELWTNKLTTPLEEVNQIQEQLKSL